VGFKYGGNIFGFPKPDTSGWADTHTGRFFVFLQSVNTEVALYGYLLPVVKLHGPEGAGFQTGLTADTEVLIDQHNPLVVSANGHYRTGLPAGGFSTVMAIPGEIIRRILGHFDQSRPDTELVFLLASHFAGMATHTILLKDIKIKPFHPVPPKSKLSYPSP
jgi:hypothetical protein